MKKLAFMFLAFFSMLLGFFQSAQAAIPTEVTTALTDTKTDVATIGTTVLIIAVTIATFIWLRKPVH